MEEPLPSEGSIRSSVWRVRSEGEQRTRAGRIFFRRMYLAMIRAARSPRGASGRSRSARVGSDQLDFPCRSRMTVRTRVTVPAGRLEVKQRRCLSSAVRAAAVPKVESMAHFQQKMTRCYPHARRETGPLHFVRDANGSADT